MRRVGKKRGLVQWGPSFGGIESVLGEIIYGGQCPESSVTRQGGSKGQLSVCVFGGGVEFVCWWL